MKQYIVLINFTEQGMKNIKTLPKRIQATRRTLEKSGGKFIRWNLTMGMYDSIAIVEFPDDATFATTILDAGKNGNIETTTLKAFSETEAAEIIARIS